MFQFLSFLSPSLCAPPPFLCLLLASFQCKGYNSSIHILEIIMMLIWVYIQYRTSLVALVVKTLTAVQETQVRSLDQEDPLEKEWLPTGEFLPGETHRQRNLAGYSPWGCKELNTTNTTEGTSIQYSTWHMLNIWKMSLFPS